MYLYKRDGSEEIEDVFFRRRSFESVTLAVVHTSWVQGKSDRIAVVYFTHLKQMKGFA